MSQTTGKSTALKDGISVIICCFNSAWIIQRCLEALLSQKTKETFQWEIIVVNNASTDETSKIAEKVLQEGEVSYQVIDEQTPGLLNARKKGISCVNYNYVIYCDDDNLLCDTYVQTAYDIINNCPDLGALGGKGVAEFLSDPDPLVLKYLKGYAVGNQHGHAYQTLWGAGVCLRVDVVKKIYSQQTMHLVGRKGDILLAGDDAELMMSIRLNGYKLDCDDRLIFTHVLSAKRLTVEYLTKMREGFALSAPVISIYNIQLKKRPFIFIYIYFFLAVFNCIKLQLCEPTGNRSLEIKYRKAIVKAYSFWGGKKLKSIYKELSMLY